jgi:hypothetical protein
MTLPILTRDTVEGYISQSARDIALADISTRVKEELEIMKGKNVELYNYGMEITEKLDVGVRGIYLTGFVQSFSLLDRQDNTDTLEGKAETH